MISILRSTNVPISTEISDLICENRDNCHLHAPEEAPLHQSDNERTTGPLVEVSELVLLNLAGSRTEHQWKNLDLLANINQAAQTSTSSCWRFRSRAAPPAPPSGPSAGISMLLEANLLALMWMRRSEEAPQAEQLLWATLTITCSC